MLEAPYKKEDRNGDAVGNDKHKDREKRKESSGSSKEKRSKHKHDRKHKRSRSRERKRSRSRDRKRSRSKSRDRKEGRSRDRKRSKSRERKRSHSREKIRSRDRKRSRSKDRKRSRSRDRIIAPRFPQRKEIHIRDPFRKRRSITKSPPRHPEPEMSPEERDARTIFCMQLSAKIRPRDLEEFFSSVGKVRDVRLITDNKTRRSKGIAYVEFGEVESVPLAMGLDGQRLLGVPIIVQASQAEKNRLGAASSIIQKGNTGPMRLYVGSLHFNITEDMLRGIFEPFGKIEQVNLVLDLDTGRSKGFGFVTFRNAEDAKKALEQLNGFELAGRPMKVGHVTERTGENAGMSMLDSDEMDRAGIDLGATGRLQLMAKLAEGTGFQIPPVAASALNLNPNAPPGAVPAPATPIVAPPIATQCFMLSNMFDPTTETAPNWEVEIQDDVIDECNKHGGVLHIYVDKASPQGNVYVKCLSIAAAAASVNALHGRYFAGKVITAAYVPLPNYHALFPDAAQAVQLVMSSSQAASARALGTGGVLAPGLQYMQA
ncbi:RNA-binding protein 39 [Lamellibrachia satsuma]|nr:RNA-binding protein 39 [Lamellibrachia satsuma]